MIIAPRVATDAYVSAHSARALVRCQCVPLRSVRSVAPLPRVIYWATPWLAALAYDHLKDERGLQVRSSTCPTWVPVFTSSVPPVVLSVRCMPRRTSAVSDVIQPMSRGSPSRWSTRLKNRMRPGPTSFQLAHAAGIDVARFCGTDSFHSHGTARCGPGTYSELQMPSLSVGIKSADV